MKVFLQVSRRPRRLKLFVPPDGALAHLKYKIRRNLAHTVSLTEVFEQLRWVSPSCTRFSITRLEVCGVCDKKMMEKFKK